MLGDGTVLRLLAVPQQPDAVLEIVEVSLGEQGTAVLEPDQFKTTFPAVKTTYSPHPTLTVALLRCSSPVYRLCVPQPLSYPRLPRGSESWSLTLVGGDYRSNTLCWVDGLIFWGRARCCVFSVRLIAAGLGLMSFDVQ